MGKLYIIGNGFDLHYGLKTKPSDFIQFLKKESVYNSLNNAFEELKELNVLWSNFEEDISYIDFDRIEEEHLSSPDYSSDHESDRDGGIFEIECFLNSIYDAIFAALRQMVKQADSTYLTKDFHLNDEDAIISFNYTTTIERVAFDLPIKPIFYIHGCESHGDKLVLGYNEEQKDYNFNKYNEPEYFDFYLNEQITRMRRFYLALKKKRKEDKLVEFISTLNDIDEIIVLGHSIGKVDLPYFEIIESVIHPSQWRVSFYSKDDDVLANINELSFVSKIYPFRW